jgi:hypothetical protein
LEAEAASKQVLFQPKPSRANSLWVLVFLTVLGVLFCEMSGSTRHNFNCCISASSELIGADVFIDHQKVGSIAKEEAGGLGGGAFRILLPSGHHLVEVKKPDYKDFSRDVDMKKELYIEANLSRTSG